MTLSANDFESLIRAAPGPRAVFARDFSIVAMNDALLQATGRSRADVVGRNLFEVFPENPDASDGPRSLRASLERVFSTGRPDRMPVTRYDLQRETPAGTTFVERHWDPLNYPILDEAGRVTHVVHEVEDVTEVVRLRRSEVESSAELVEARSVYEAIYDQGLFAGRIDLDGTLVDANRSSLEQCGFSREDVVGKPFWECGWWNRSADVQAWVRAAVETARGGRAFRGVSTYFVADGSERVVEFACMPIKDRTGQVRFLLPTGIDITERTHAEREQRTTAILESITDAFISLDREWRFTYLNPQAEPQLLRARGDLLGKVLWDEFPAALGTKFEREYRSAMAERKAVTFEEYYPAPLDRWYEVNAYPTEEGLAVYFRNVTERRRAEEALAEGEAKYRGLFETIDEGVCYIERLPTGPDGVRDYRYLAMNRAMREMFGIDDLTGRTIRECFPHEAESWYDDYDRALETGQAIRFERESEPQDMVLSMFVSRVDDGSGKRLIVVMHDVTERHRAERALRASEERYRTLFNSIDEGFCVIEVIFDASGRPADYRYLETNPAFRSQTGLENAVGRTASELVPGHEDRWYRTYGEVARTGEPVRFTDEAKSLGRWFDVYAFRLGEPRDRRVAVLFKDVTEARRAEQELRSSEESQAYLVRLADTLRPLSDPDDVQAAANRVLGEQLGANRVAYFEIAGPEYVVERDYADGVESLAGRYPVASFGAELLEAFLAGRTVIENDATAVLSRDPSERAAFSAIQVRGHVDVPLVKAGVFVAGMTVHACEARDWTADEVALIEQTAERTWAAVERARAERALRASEERFRSLFESMDEGYCVVEPVFDSAGRPVDYRYLLVNPALEHHTGLRDIVGKTARELMPGHESYWIEAYARVAATGEPFRRTDRAADLGRWFEVSAFTVGRGQVGVLFADVTARHDAEEGLRASEARLAEIFRHAPSFMCVLSGPDHVFERVNDRYLELIGGRSVAGMPIREALPEIAGQGYFEMLGQVYATGEPYIGTARRVAIERGGQLEERVVDFVYQPIRDAGGAVTGVLVQGLDITARLEAERLLLESEERYRTLAENVEHLFWTCLPDGRCDYLSSQWVRYTGIPEEEQLGFEWIARVIHPDDRDRTLKVWMESVNDRATYDVNYRIRGADGEYRWFKTRGTPIRDASGAIAKWFGTCTDIDAQVRAEVALREADRKKDEFLAMLAHELRNPLAAIGNAVQLSGRSQAREHQEWSREVIGKHVGSLSRMIDDLLDVSRITRGKIELRREPLNVLPILSNAADTVRPLIQEKKHELTVSHSSSSPMWVEADAHRLEQVIVNLLNNAAKYTDPGGTITLSARPEGDSIAITVTDNGSGIPPKKIPEMFELFTQGDRSIARSEGGLGIGLTLVKSLVEMHGGSVVARSEGTGRGSQFTVRLPAVAAPTQVRNVASAPHADAPRSGARVLVVDDNHDSAVGLSRLLKVLGNDVEVAHDGTDALRAAHRFRPDYVLLDIGLPGMDGYEVAEKLRGEGFLETVIIAVSGYGEEAARRRSREAGINHHLVKPVDYDTLVALIRREN